MYDTIIIGGGPAGLTAAIYLRRSNKSVLVIEKRCLGGRINYSPKVQNIPGFSIVTGSQFADLLVNQAEGQGVEFEIDEVIKVIPGVLKKVITESGTVFETRSIVIATGTKDKVLGLPNETDLIGKGISFCALCDGQFYAGKKVAVVGRGNTALQEAEFLSNIAEEVILIQNQNYFKGESALVENLLRKPNVTFLSDCLISELKSGDDGDLYALVVKDTCTSREFLLYVDGLFEAIGTVPETEPFKDILEFDKDNYVLSTEECRTPFSGICVAGDCRSKLARQVVTACADGAVSALTIIKYLEGRERNEKDSSI